MARIVIADAGPLIALAKADLLGLLKDLFGSVVVPERVFTECMASPGVDSQRIEAAVSDSILVLRGATTSVPPVNFPLSLAGGEKQALTLALENSGALLIVDDRLARKQAAKLGTNYIGTVRLLDIAQKRGLVKDAEAIIDAMREQGYRISTDILNALRAESPAP